MIRDRISRNVCLIMFVVQCCCILRFVTEIALGGTTEWWQPVGAAVIAAALYVQFSRFRKKVRQEAMTRKKEKCDGEFE